jgi:hypothetical protein
VKVLRITKVAVVMSLTALVPLAAHAQFVKGNEAVRVMTDGSKQVESPPLPTTSSFQSTKPCLASAGCNAGPWLMVETSQGLKECTEAYARAGSCRDSSYGKAKVSRLWVVKSGGNWLQCQYPDLGSKCVNMFARPPANLPFDAVQ